MTTIVELDGNIRDVIGNSSSKKLLRENKIPAVIYSEDKNKENIYIELDLRKFETEYLKGNVQLKIFHIKAGNKVYKVIPYQIDIHPVTDRPRHIDFISVEGKKEIKVMVPLRCLNAQKAPGMKKGGYLNIIKRKLQLFVNPNNIPDCIDVDCGNLLLKQSVKISQIKLPEGTRPVTKKDLILVTVTGRGKNTDDDVAKVQATTAATTTTATTTATTTDSKK